MYVWMQVCCIYKHLTLVMRLHVRFDLEVLVCGLCKRCSDAKGCPDSFVMVCICIHICVIYNTHHDNYIQTDIYYARLISCQCTVAGLARRCWNQDPVQGSPKDLPQSSSRLVPRTCDTFEQPAWTSTNKLPLHGAIVSPPTAIQPTNCGRPAISPKPK